MTETIDTKVGNPPNSKENIHRISLTHNVSILYSYDLTLFQSYTLPILHFPIIHSSNYTLFQSNILPILHHSNLSFFQSFTLPSSNIRILFIIHTNIHNLYSFVVRCAYKCSDIVEKCEDNSSEEEGRATTRRTTTRRTSTRRTTTRRTTTRRPQNMSDEDHMNPRNQTMYHTQKDSKGSQGACPGSLDNCIAACPASPVGGHSSQKLWQFLIKEKILFHNFHISSLFLHKMEISPEKQNAKSA